MQRNKENVFCGLYLYILSFSSRCFLYDKADAPFVVGSGAAVRYNGTVGGGGPGRDVPRANTRVERRPSYFLRSWGFRSSAYYRRTIKPSSTRGTNQRAKKLIYPGCPDDRGEAEGNVGTIF